MLKNLPQVRALVRKPEHATALRLLKQVKPAGSLHAAVPPALYSPDNTRLLVRLAEDVSASVRELFEQRKPPFIHEQDYNSVGAHDRFLSHLRWARDRLAAGFPIPYLSEPNEYSWLLKKLQYYLSEGAKKGVSKPTKTRLSDEELRANASLAARLHTIAARDQRLSVIASLSTQEGCIFRKGSDFLTVRLPSGELKSISVGTPDSRASAERLLKSLGAKHPLKPHLEEALRLASSKKRWKSTLG